MLYIALVIAFSRKTEILHRARQRQSPHSPVKAQEGVMYKIRRKTYYELVADKENFMGIL